MAETLTPAQRRTLPAREALAGKFRNPEAKSEYYRALAAKANARRVVLSGDEADALAGAYRLLGEIVGRARRASAATSPSANKEATAGIGPAAAEGVR